MEPDRWEQIERLYHAALEREPDAREAFLDEACAGDEDLRREVAGLLACDVPIFRFKTIFGDRLQTRQIDNQFKELILKSFTSGIRLHRNE
jgi:hypothetical protein